jgi:transcriptional regulator with XRE-family HTH domain
MTMEKTLVEKYLEDPTRVRFFQQEGAIYRVTELIESVMRKEKVTRGELAKRLGKTKGWVTQLLDGEANKTIRTVADVLAVLGHELQFSSPSIKFGADEPNHSGRNGRLEKNQVIKSAARR